MLLSSLTGVEETSSTWQRREDARHPARYRMLVGMVDVIFSEVAHYFLLIIDTCFLIILFAMFVNLDSLFGAGNALLC